MLNGNFLLLPCHRSAAGSSAGRIKLNFAALGSGGGGRGDGGAAGHRGGGTWPAGRGRPHPPCPRHPHYRRGPFGSPGLGHTLRGEPKYGHFASSSGTTVKQQFDKKLASFFPLHFAVYGLLLVRSYLNRQDKKALSGPDFPQISAGSERRSSQISCFIYLWVFFPFI